MEILPLVQTTGLLRALEGKKSQRNVRSFLRLSWSSWIFLLERHVFLARQALPTLQILESGPLDLSSLTMIAAIFEKLRVVSYSRWNKCSFQSYGSIKSEYNRNLSGGSDGRPASRLEGIMDNLTSAGGPMLGNLMEAPPRFDGGGWIVIICYLYWWQKAPQNWTEFWLNVKKMR